MKNNYKLTITNNKTGEEEAVIDGNIFIIGYNAATEEGSDYGTGTRIVGGGSRMQIAAAMMGAVRGYKVICRNNPAFALIDKLGFFTESADEDLDKDSGEYRQVTFPTALFGDKKDKNE
jgi:hypothetical protein